MISRRTFLPTALAAAPLSAAEKPRAGCQTNAWDLEPPDFSRLLNVLRNIRKIGYDGFETGFRNLLLQEGALAPAKEAIVKTGLRLIGVHIFLPDYDRETGIAPADLIKRVTNVASKLGAERLILSGATAPPGNKADALSAADEQARRMGLRVAYHNHPQDMSSLDKLLKSTTADLMLDAGHAFSAGANVAAFFSEHHARIVGMHLRDFRAGSQVVLGKGEFDMSQLATAVRSLHWSGWLINEEERLNNYKPGDAAVIPARKALRDIFGV
jgi:inosose dehydratase